MSELVFRPRVRRRKVTLNLTPLLDVLFLLLIFLMLTSTFRRAGEMDLSLPESSTSTPRPTGQQIAPTEVALGADGTVYLDGEAIDDESLLEQLRVRREQSEDGRVLLSAEAAARHADVVRLIDLVREAGFRGLSLGTEIRTLRNASGGAVEDEDE